MAVTALEVSASRRSKLQVFRSWRTRVRARWEAAELGRAAEGGPNRGGLRIGSPPPVRLSRKRGLRSAPEMPIMDGGIACWRSQRRAPRSDRGCPGEGATVTRYFLFAAYGLPPRESEGAEPEREQSGRLPACGRPRRSSRSWPIVAVARRGRPRPSGIARSRRGSPTGRSRSRR